jgi:hypothetical protein
MSANGGFGPVSTGGAGAVATLLAFLAAAYPSVVMAATTGTDAISAAASRSASFRMGITKRFSTDLAKIQRTHFFLVPHFFAGLSKGLVVLL